MRAGQARAAEIAKRDDAAGSGSADGKANAEEKLADASDSARPRRRKGPKSVGWPPMTARFACRSDVPSRLPDAGLALASTGQAGIDGRQVLAVEGRQ